MDGAAAAIATNNTSSIITATTSTWPSIRKGHSRTTSSSQLDTGSALKALAYENITEGLPPRKVSSVARSNSPNDDDDDDDDNNNNNNRNNNNNNNSNNDNDLLSQTGSFNSAAWPRTSPSSPHYYHHHSPRAFFDANSIPPSNSKSNSNSNSLLLLNDTKRDSGIAPSVSTVHTNAASFDSKNLPALVSAVPPPGVHPALSAASSQNLSPPRDLPPIPTILVQDEVLPFEAAKRSRSPFSSRKKSTEQSRMRLRQARSASPPPIARMTSFQGLQTTIPATSVDDISLEDLASNKVGFSTRGSLLFGGRKMQDLIHKQGDGGNGTSSPAPPVSPLDASSSPDDSPRGLRTVSPGALDQHRNGATTPTKQKRQGLVAGRRQPSVQMLQAAIHGGRVLSAEEITFSMKVRSMYEHGDERAAEWVTPSTRATSGKMTPDALARDTPTSDWTHEGLQIPKARQDDENWPLSNNRLSVVSKYSRTSNELAGGIEDWDNVDGRLVDRYGFIQQDRTVSRDSETSTRHGMQRIATSLRVEAEQPRRERSKLTRGLSSKRSSRSMPPPSKEWAVRRGPGSVHSMHSTSSRKSHLAFRSKKTRLLAEAADMLTCPPGLEDIDESEDAGKTASAAKQREWAREEKWQKMARTVKRRNEGKGGGMHFEFDMTDPKLVERTWKGIPDRWRATAWHGFLSASAKRRGSHATDEELIGQFHKLQESSCADDVQIDVDVPRTVQLHIMFRRRYRGGQRLLFRVLHAMALYFPDVGYVQGMASIAVTLLCYFDEENAFVMMARLWQLRGLESFFKEDFAGLMAALAEFEKDWLSNGDVARKLDDLGITSTTYGTRWYLTLFNMSVPFPAQLRIWDVFMLLGDAPVNDMLSSSSPGIMDGNQFGGADLDVLHATSAALIDATREIILDSDFENAMKVLTSFIPVRDEDVLMRVAKTEYKMRKKRGNTLGTKV